MEGRHELLAKSSPLDEEELRVVRPEYGLTLEQAYHMVENAVGLLGVPGTAGQNPEIEPGGRSGSRLML
jgi:hydroxymethylglutaryl-CoA reductase